MSKQKSDILANDGLHLKMMYNTITIDKELPKYSLIKKEVENFKKENFSATLAIEEAEESGMDVDVNDLRHSLRERDAIKDIIRNYDKIRFGNIRDVNIFINKHLFSDVFSGFNEYGSKASFSDNVINNPEGIVFSDVKQEKKKKKFAVFRLLSEIMNTKSKELEETVSVSVLEFFARVKGLAKENKDTYVDRLAGYIVALKNCDVSGQTALKEKLVRDMVINKYESVLYAQGHYYVVTEPQVVDFVKKTEKGVRLTYIKNYMRIIPPEVVEKIKEMNKLEIFDNYAILHYDPDSLAYGETIEETKKRRDPILFGLIKGSNKLYYVTDWIDEFCDLTLDKFVETLQIDKNALKLPETINVE